jgi:hypothetical protein
MRTFTRCATRPIYFLLKKVPTRSSSPYEGVEIGRQMVLKTPASRLEKSNLDSKKNCEIDAFSMVEMGGLEPPTPYMRSDSGAKDASTKKARKRRKAS